MPRNLDRAPIVESVVEIRWNSPAIGGGETALYEEYEVGLGQIVTHYKAKDYRRIPIASLPKQMYPMINQRFPLDRIQPNSETGNTINEPTYPLIQYGPGIASIHVDKKSYDWKKVRESAIELYKVLSGMHDNLIPRLSQISCRAIDVFESDNEPDFLKKKLKFDLVNPISSLELLSSAKSDFNLVQTWNLPDINSVLRFSLGYGTAGNITGLLSDIHIATSPPDIQTRQFEEILDSQHKITGDIFFGLLSKELRSELGYSD